MCEGSLIPKDRQGRRPRRPADQRWIFPFPGVQPQSFGNCVRGLITSHSCLNCRITWLCCKLWMRCVGLCDYVSSYTSHRLIFKRLMNNVESKPLYHSAMALRKLGRKIRELGFPVPFRKHFSYTRAISVCVDCFSLWGGCYSRETAGRTQLLLFLFLENSYK